MKSSVWQEGVFELECVADRAAGLQMYDEAMRLHRSLKTVEWGEGDGIGTFPNGAIVTDAHYAFHPGGDHLKSFSTSDRVMDTIKRSLGVSQIRFVHCTYNYYEQDDFLGVHKDSDKSFVTFTFGVTDNLTSMRIARDLRGLTNDQTEAAIRDRGIFPEGFETVPVRSGGIHGFFGNDIPHWRMPFERDFGILATFAYSIPDFMKPSFMSPGRG